MERADPISQDTKSNFGLRRTRWRKWGESEVRKRYRTFLGIRSCLLLAACCSLAGTGKSTFKVCWADKRLKRLTTKQTCFIPGGTIRFMRFIHARYEEGSLKPTERLALRQGEWVNLILVRRADASRWNLDRLAKSQNGEDLALAEQGLTEWALKLDEQDSS